MAKRNETFDEFLVRFWGNVNQHDVANSDPLQCWPWKKPRKHGYGRIFYRGKELQAHRVSYELINGVIPDGCEIDHLCRNPSCIKPSHMEAVPSKENTRRGIGPTAINAAKTACPQGHPYTLENTYLPPRGGRYCRICKREKMRVLQAKKRATARTYRATLAAKDAGKAVSSD